MEIKLSNNTGFSIVPEGEQILEITKCVALPSGNPKFIEVEYKHSNGGTIKSTFDLANEKGLTVFSILVSKLLGANTIFNTDDCKDLVNKKVKVEIAHTNVPSKKDPEKTLTFANIKKILDKVEESTISEDEDLD